MGQPEDVVVLLEDMEDMALVGGMALAEGTVLVGVVQNENP